MALLQSRFNLQRIIIAVGTIGFIVFVVGTVEVPAPLQLRGDLQAQGKIVECDIHKMTRASEVFFVGIRLDSLAIPYLRANPLHAERKRFEAMCADHAKVHITYRAKARVLGPVRFWIQDIATDPR